MQPLHGRGGVATYSSELVAEMQRSQEPFLQCCQVMAKNLTDGKAVTAAYMGVTTPCNHTYSWDCVHVVVALVNSRSMMSGFCHSDGVIGRVAWSRVKGSSWTVTGCDPGRSSKYHTYWSEYSWYV